MCEVLDENFMVCSDCLMAVANDDFSGLDYHLSEVEATERMAHIQSSIAEIDGYVTVGNSENDESFSQSKCECCDTTLHGSRHHCVILK